MLRRLIARVASYILRTLKSSPTSITLKTITYPDNFLMGLNCVITGGGKGLGLAMAKKLVTSGANVIITGRSEEALKETCRTLGSGCRYLIFDSTDFEKYDYFFGKILKMMPNLNAMILNAGISLHEGLFDNVNKDGFQKQMDINFKAAYFMAQEYVKRVKKGHLLFISSETGAMKCVLPYGLTKAMIDSLVPALSFKYYQSGLRVNAIAPGSTLTNMVKNNNAVQDDFYYPNAAARYFLPEEVAEVAAFLLSDASKCISGEVIHTNAGNHFRVQ